MPNDSSNNTLCEVGRNIKLDIHVDLEKEFPNQRPVVELFAKDI